MRIAFNIEPIMLRCVLLIAIAFTCGTPTAARQLKPSPGDRIQVEVELEFEKPTGEIVHVELKVPGRTDRPVRATLDFDDNYHLEMESVPIPGPQYQFKTKVSVVQKTSTGGVDVIFRPQMTAFANDKAELQVNSRKLAVLVRNLK